ncbi:MAG: pectate lyase family protein, partial [Candidatus Binatia bacterium]
MALALAARPAAAYQGFGASTPGGAGKPVYRVTNLNDSGPGSFRDAVSQGNRTVVFDVTGTINLLSAVSIKGGFLTIDGLSAPPPGVTLRNAGLRLSDSTVHDVIVRGIRVRSPGINDSSGDGISIKYGAYNVVIDHVSVHDCGDGSLDITKGAHDVTVSWSVFSGCAKNMLIKYEASRVSLHHNVFVDSQYRNPWVNNLDDGTPAPDTTVDMRNNLVWNWGNSGGGTGAECGANVNVVNNWYSSPGTTPDRQAKALMVNG